MDVSREQTPIPKLKTLYSQRKNRHLYDPERKRYVSFSEIIEDLRAGYEVQVINRSFTTNYGPKREGTRQALEAILIRSIKELSTNAIIAALKTY